MVGRIACAGVGMAALKLVAGVPGAGAVFAASVLKSNGAGVGGVAAGVVGAATAGEGAAAIVGGTGSPFLSASNACAGVLLPTGGAAAAGVPPATLAAAIAELDGSASPGRHPNGLPVRRLIFTAPLCWSGARMPVICPRLD